MTLGVRVQGQGTQGAERNEGTNSWENVRWGGVWQGWLGTKFLWEKLLEKAAGLWREYLPLGDALFL